LITETVIFISFLFVSLIYVLLKKYKDLELIEKNYTFFQKFITVINDL